MHLTFPERKPKPSGARGWWDGEGSVNAMLSDKRNVKQWVSENKKVLLQHEHRAETGILR